MTTNTECELLPCPFCGSPAKNVSSNYAGPSYHWHADDAMFAVNCVQCGASVPNMRNNERVVAKWNRRAALSAAPDAQREQDRLDAERLQWIFADTDNAELVYCRVMSGDTPEQVFAEIDAAIVQAKSATFEHGGVTVINTGAKV